MYFFTKLSMKVIAAIILTFVLVFTSLTGCKDEANTNSNQITLIPDPRSPEQIKQERIKQFKESLPNSRKMWNRLAEKDPNGKNLVTIGLKDYFLLSTVEDFAKRYPKLKFIDVNTMLYGSKGGIEVDNTKPLSEELERAIKSEQEWATKRLEEAKKDKPTQYYSQAAVDSSLAHAQLVYDLAMSRTIRTMGFVLEGTNKEIAEMVETESKGNYVRLADHTRRNSYGDIMKYYWEPIYACEPGSCPNRSK